MQYKEVGEEMVSMLDGMYSFVLLDTRDNTFMAARDPIGITPLYIGIHRHIVCLAKWPFQGILGNTQSDFEPHYAAIPLRKTFTRSVFLSPCLHHWLFLALSRKLVASLAVVDNSRKFPVGPQTLQLYSVSENTHVSCVLVSISILLAYLTVLFFVSQTSSPREYSDWALRPQFLRYPKKVCRTWYWPTSETEYFKMLSTVVMGTFT